MIFRARIMRGAAMRLFANNIYLLNRAVETAAYQFATTRASPIEHEYE